MTVVIDTSVTMAWCFEDEVSPRTEALLDRLPQTGATVPAIWVQEVANILVVGERRGRLTPEKSGGFLRLLLSLPIRIDHTTPTRCFGPVLELARAQHLTVYDASYLDLAMQLRLPLATQDTALRAAADRVGVALAP